MRGACSVIVQFDQAKRRMRPGLAIVARSDANVVEAVAERFD
jgi:hypothetical protein